MPGSQQTRALYGAALRRAAAAEQQAQIHRELMNQQLVVAEENRRDADRLFSQLMSEIRDEEATSGPVG